MLDAKLSYPLRVSRRADPISGCSGSAGALPALSGQETQYAAVLLASLTLYVVSLPCPEIGRSAPEKGGVVIHWPWYTSGNFVKREKSDQDGTAVR